MYCYQNLCYDFKQQTCAEIVLGSALILLWLEKNAIGFNGLSEEERASLMQLPPSLGSFRSCGAWQ